MVAKILVVADDEAVRDSLHTLLQAFGYDVAAYASGEDVIDGKKPKADCLLVDQYMSGMTGLDLVEHLRSKADRIPAAIMSGRNDARVIKRARQIGITILPKPLPCEILVTCIEQACNAAP